MSGLPKRKEHYGPIAPGIVFNPYPNCQHCPFEKKQESCGYFCLDFLQQKIRYESAQDIAAVIIEPYQGADIAYPPQGYLKRLRQWTQVNGILLIFDEIQAGLGRSGSLYCYQKEGVEPDMLLLGKGLGNGLHISALLTKQIPQEEYLHAVTGGAGDDCIACAAAALSSLKRAPNCLTAVVIASTERVISVCIALMVFRYSFWRRLTRSICSTLSVIFCSSSVFAAAIALAIASGSSTLMTTLYVVSS